jgi:prephenate dehydrogenase
MMRGAVAILGYGRLGQTLAELSSRGGLSLRVHDPVVAPPAEWAAPTLADAVADTEVIVLAVPLDALESILASLSPRLRPDQLVIEATSVKLEPTRILEAALGEGTAWVATHPLFGPASLREPDPVRRVVICPRGTRPELVARARSFYERLGVVVDEMDADAHDRLMARTQAPAFFVGAGLARADLAPAEPCVPPSAAALTRLREAASAQRKHVYDTIVAHNPYAASERRRLLDALRELDDDARAPAAPDPTTRLRDARVQIDALDRSLIGLLAQRARVARTISRAKAELGRPVQDLHREQEAFEQRRTWARQDALEEAFTTRIFEEILAWSRAIQEADRRG